MIGRDDSTAAETWSNPHVVDGDTLDATNPDGTIERIRVLGIDAPEWDACGEAEATAYLTELLAGVEEIELVRDPSQAERDMREAGLNPEAPTPRNGMTPAPRSLGIQLPPMRRSR